MKAGTREISWDEFEKHAPMFGPCNQCNKVGPFVMRRMVEMSRKESGPPPPGVPKGTKALKPAGGLCMDCAMALARGQRH